ncbi:MAG: SprT family zinc-dependent metalloprotease [Methylotenera sp.]|uniref:M48 family metallopeptidase n=1 Tax=Methylotenera sp. TaxID=2051956 RepID=UPI00248A27AE|nr:SprT family zinc-dependent metalloprotease [Methylotenera sp.]MDI1310024.1 SprT family zinc-dependent metalloprotease [Methylotenera sp.]
MSHSLTLPSGDHLHYQLERRQRRTVGLKITQTGLVIHAPKRISQSQLEDIILQKSDWVLRKLASVTANKIPEIQWQHGEQLLFLGNAITLTIEHNARSKAVEYEPGVLQLAMPNQDEMLIARKVVQWYKKQAITDFTRRLEIFSSKLGVQFTSLTLSNAASRWGSCNSKKEIRLNWRLLQAPPHIINYVICHELAHIKEMNHSAKFWATVAGIFPNYKSAEKELKAISAQLHRF